MKTSELTGAALDWAVAKCESKLPASYDDWEQVWPKYSTNWAQGGPIIEREKISLRDESYTHTGGWYAVMLGEEFQYGSIPFKTVLGWDGAGDTALIAAMRCFVASKLGDEVDVPEELL